MKIRIYDELHPEDNAMLQALYARSAESVDVHMEKVKQVGSGKFMSTYYVGYGHKSIADCGSTTIFIEGVSMLAAKAIQDWPLYSGQETSTRAIDMSKQPMISPEGLQAELDILYPLRQFYLNSQDEVANHVRTSHAKMEAESDVNFERAVKARTFDILRGFLPAACATQLSWHTNLRQAGDHIDLLKHHPLEEVRDIADQILMRLEDQYPSTFPKNQKQYPEQKRYRRGLRRVTYFDPPRCPYDAVLTAEYDKELLDYQYLLMERPLKTNLPEFLTGLGRFNFQFQLDFGSFRDLQRHRHGICRMPLLSTRWHFHSWYIKQLPDALKQRAAELLESTDEKISKLHVGDIKAQYYVPMGYLVPCHVTYGLPAAVYIADLRTQKTVHPTMRAAAMQMANCLREELPSLALHDDRDQDDWSTRRGKQLVLEQKS